MASPIKRRVPQWEVKAKKELAMWKQHLPIAKAIAQSEIIVRCATRRGLAIDALKEHRFSNLEESPVYAAVLQEAEAEILKWEKNLEVIEGIVYARFLLDAAKEVGIAVERVREWPYLRRPATKDQSLQASFPCSDCMALEASMMSDEGEFVQGEEQPNLQDSVEGQSQQPLF